MSLKILIVEDSIFTAHLVSNICVYEGFKEILIERSGLRAIMRALEFQPQIIFMDLVLPEENGVEASRKILDVLPDTYIIAMTSLENKIIVNEALEAGCSELIQKPFSKNQIVDALNRGINKIEKATRSKIAI